MRSLVTIAAAGACFLASVAAHADPQNFYVRLDTGGSFSRNAGQDVGVDIGASPIVGAGIGAKLFPFLRTDVTLSYRPDYSFTAPDTTLVPGTIGRGDVKTLAVLVNAYYDFPSFAGFTPYVGGGVGMARNEVGTTTLSDPGSGATVATLSGSTTTQFAWQVGAGVSYSILPFVALDVGYRYLDAGEGRSGTSGTFLGAPITAPVQRGNIRAHEIQAGIRVGF